MKLLFACVAAGFVCSTPAVAVEVDDLSRCVRAKVSEQDRNILARWAIAAAAKNPAVSDMMMTVDAKGDEITSNARNVFQRLILVDCRAESIAAIRTGGFHKLSPAINSLNKMGFESLISAPEVRAEGEKASKFKDPTAWAKLAAEAGIDPTKPPK